MRATKTPTGKAPKGSVSVLSFQNRLRLQFRVNGKQQVLSLGLDNTPENWKRAEIIARQIEIDLGSGDFDQTLAKYKPKKQQHQQKLLKADTITISQLFQEFIDHRSKEVDKRTLEKYRATINYLNEFACKDGMDQKCLGDKPACYLSENCAQQFAEWLKDKNSARVLKERLGLLSACWEWARKPRIVECNPWKPLQDRLKVPPKQQPKPFTKDEIRRILEEFKADPHYRHYYPFVFFRFACGVRTGEAIGLCWKHIEDDFSKIWIGESFTKGVRKSTKNNKDRWIPVNDELKGLLLSIKPENTNPDDFVFLTRQGNPIDEHNFSQRAWKTILNRLGIPYRRPYTSRSSFISHCLEAGHSPSSVASVSGHDVKVLYRSYAGVVNPISLPNVF